MDEGRKRVVAIIATSWRGTWTLLTIYLAVRKGAEGVRKAQHK